MKKAFLFLTVAALISARVHASGVNKDSASYHMSLAKEAEEQRRYSVAWQHYEQAARFDDSNPAVYTSIAKVCTQMNKMAPALKAIEKAYSLQPDNAELEAQLFGFYFNYSQWDKVIEHGQSMLAGHNAPAGTNFKVGRAYYAKQNFGKSIDYLKKAIKEDPSNAEAHYLVGRMLVNMENYAAAVPYYEHSIELDTTQPLRTYEFAMLLSTNLQFAKSVKYYERALDQGYAANDDFYLNMAYAYADAKLVDQGISLFKRLVAKRPQDLGLLDAMACTYFGAGKYKDAIAAWDQILAIDKNNARALYHIGLTYIKTGKETEGKQLCDKAIEMEPSLATLRQKMTM